MADNIKMVLHLIDSPPNEEIKSSSNSVLRSVGECITLDLFWPILLNEYSSSSTMRKV